MLYVRRSKYIYLKAFSQKYVISFTPSRKRRLLKFTLDNFFGEAQYKQEKII